MIRRASLALALAAALAAGCGGPRKERREARAERPPPREAARGGLGAGPGPEGKQEGMKPRPGGPRVPATPEGLLGQEAVGKLQQALAGRGLLGEHREGELDGPTSAAVKRFQQQQGLAETGMPDRETLRRLGVSADRAFGPARGEKG